MELAIVGSVRVKKFKATKNEKNEGVTVKGILEFDGGYDFDAKEKMTGEITFMLVENFKSRIDFLKSIMKDGSTFIVSGKLIVKNIKEDKRLVLEIKDYGFGMAGTSGSGSGNGNHKKEEKKEEKSPKNNTKDIDFDDDDEFPF